ncbi:TPA: hypothetical protein NIK24_004980 [Pseudomonas aeruginosa]|uniref:hypothetical protein n=1 Tax=Pseudomonas aeruginosa TaxID=287 RepID=UPI003CF8B1BB|nr:hypothetical protein [Pseudomonas aeruginosa]
MTTPISDEQLAQVEEIAFRDTATRVTVKASDLRGLIARLRAAEADTKRLDWLSKKGAEEDPSQGDVRPYIDAAMERTP